MNQKLKSDIAKTANFAICIYILCRKRNFCNLKGGDTMDKTQMAVIAGIVLCVIVGCIAGGVF